MEAGTERSDVRVADGGPEDIEHSPDPKQAVASAASKPPKDTATHDAALDWLLSDEPEEGLDDTLDLRLNVGGAREGTEKWIVWTIQPVDGEVIRRIRRQAAGAGGGRQARRAAQGGDEEQANRRIVVAGTVHPPIKKIAGDKGIADPATLIEQKFQRKPGLVQQLVMEILSLSGYDDDDVREVTASGKLITAGGEATRLYRAWRYGGEDPYCLYNGLTKDFRPLDEPEAPPRPPPFPSRYRAFLYACADHAFMEDVKLSGAKLATRQARG